MYMPDVASFDASGASGRVDNSGKLHLETSESHVEPLTQDSPTDKPKAPQSPRKRRSPTPIPLVPTRLRTTIKLTCDQAESTLGPGRQRAPPPPPPPATRPPKKSRKPRQQPENVVSREDVLVNEAAPLVADTSLPPITVLVAEAEPIPSKRGQLAVPGNDILPPATVLAEAPPAFSHQPPQPPQQQTRLFTAQQPSGWPGASYPWPPPNGFSIRPYGPHRLPHNNRALATCGTYRHMAGIPPLPLQADVQWPAHDSISRTWTLDGRASFPTAHRASILPWKLDTRASARSYH